MPSDVADDRPMLAVLEYVNPRDFGPRDLEHLERLADNSADGTTAVEWAQRLACGHVWLWRVAASHAPEQPILLTSILGEPPEIFFIEGAAGTGIVKNAADIKADLRLIAGYYGCRALRGVSARGQDSAMPLFGLNAVATVWELEVSDGQQAPEGNDDNLEG